MGHNETPLIKHFFCFVTLLGEIGVPENKITE